MTEAHTKVICTELRREAVVLVQGKSHLKATYFPVGYEVGYVEISQRRLRRLMASSPPPLLLYLAGGHYSAVLKSDKKRDVESLLSSNDDAPADNGRGGCANVRRETMATSPSAVEASHKKQRGAPRAILLD